MEKDRKKRCYRLSIAILNIDTQNKLKNGDIVDNRNFDND